jgi:hydroxyethylthiazole kinase-like uncharacterized protein yjeF
MTEEMTNDATALGPDLIETWPLPIDESGDKHVRGTVLVIGGSPATPGAVILSGIAALRMGAGRLQIATADGPAPAVAVAVPEALVMPLPIHGDGFAPGAAEVIAGHVERADAIVVGPGMRGRDGAATFVSTILDHVSDEAIVVLDALAMQTLGDIGPDALRRLTGRVVLTPNRQELSRLDELSRAWSDGSGAPRAESDESVDEELVGSVSRGLGVVITSFGEISAPDGRRWRCGHGTPGLGTSGSGDVLAGLITGAAARSGDAAQAACWGTYVHHAAGSRLSDRMGRLGFLARELLEEIPALWFELEQRTR